MSANGAAVGAAVNITNNAGYDNQPSFAPDGGSLFFTSIRGGATTDIYRYDIVLARGELVEPRAETARPSTGSGRASGIDRRRTASIAGRSIG